MYRKLQVIIIFLIFPLAAGYWYLEENDLTLKEVLFPSTNILHIGDIPLSVEIADTPSEREQGLSGRSEIGAADGILFIFEESDYHGFWMKDMHFAIDIIWIGEHLEVLGVTESVNPSSYPRIFEPPAPARYVVETNAHYVESFGIRKGQKVTLPLEYR